MGLEIARPRNPNFILRSANHACRSLYSYNETEDTGGDNGNSQALALELLEQGR